MERRLDAGDIYHATEHLLPWTARPSVLTVHDLIFERYPQHHTLANRSFLRVAMPLFVRRADAIIAVSRHTKQDLLELYGTPAHKVFVVEEGIEGRFRPALEEEVRQAKERHGIRRPYLLMVGTLEPRKNHQLSFEALARLKAGGFPHCLVVAGGGGWLFDDVQKKVEQLQLSEDVTFAGRVPGRRPTCPVQWCRLFPDAQPVRGIRHPRVGSDGLWNPGRLQPGQQPARGSRAQRLATSNTLTGEGLADSRSSQRVVEVHKRLEQMRTMQDCAEQPASAGEKQLCKL